MKAFLLVLTVSIGSACLPRPLDVEEEKEAFPRTRLTWNRTVMEEVPGGVDRYRVVLGDRIELLGSRVEPKHVEPGDSVTVTTYYRLLPDPACASVKEATDRCPDGVATAKSEIAESWKFFIHVDAVNRSHRLHGDHCPCEGLYPTNYWQAGEVIVDRITLQTRGHPKDEYIVWGGLYIGDRRMPITGGDSARRGKENRANMARMTLGQ